MTLSHTAKICLGAHIMSAACILQLSCVLFPVLGAVFSVACTLLTGAAGVLLKRRAAFIYLGAGFMMLAFSPRYAFEFLLTTGFVGLMLGLMINMNTVVPLLVSGLGMFAGLYGLTYLLGEAAFGGVFSGLPANGCLPVFAVFSAAYPVVGMFILKRVLNMRVFRYYCNFE